MVLRPFNFSGYSAPIRAHSATTYLRLFDNCFGGEGAKSLHRCIGEKQNTEADGFTHNCFGDKGVKFLADALAKKNKLKQLDLERNYIGEEGAKALADAFVKKKHAGTAEFDICNEGAKDLADAFVTDNTLEQLNFYLNKIGDEGAKGFAHTFAKNSTP